MYAANCICIQLKLFLPKHEVIALKLSHICFFLLICGYTFQYPQWMLKTMDSTKVRYMSFPIRMY